MKNKTPEGWESLIARIQNREGADWTKPPKDYTDFLASAEKLFVQKDTDYDSRFLRGLIVLDARTIWTWEVEKKLDRLRSWIKRGELQVKGEGIRNSVDDLFIYTVQYYAYKKQVDLNERNEDTFLRAVRRDRVTFFRSFANTYNADKWVDFLKMYGLITPDEILLQNIIRSYMGDQVLVEEWQQAIRAILS